MARRGSAVTCVAWDSVWLAGDSLITQAGIRDSNALKVHKLRDGTLLGFAGTYEDGLVLLDWVKRGEPEEGRPKRLGVDAIKVTPDGVAHACESKLKWWPIRASYYAIGSGAPYAKTAMYLGKTAHQAVQIASEFDTTTGGKINKVTNRRNRKK